MTPFIGTKSVLAIPMTKAAYNDYRGWGMPTDEAPEEEGYLIEYTDGGKPNHPDHTGYISWTPANQFDNAYQASGSMSFGHAIEAMKAGKKVSRLGWNGKGMYVLLVVECCDFAQDACDVFNDIKVNDNKGGEYPHYVPTDPYFVMRTATNTAQPGWLASQADMLANDWGIVE